MANNLRKQSKYHELKVTNPEAYKLKCKAEAARA